MDPYPRIERIWRDVGDDSPWYEKALFHAIDGLRELDEGGPHVNHPQNVAARALEKIERALRERPQERDPSIYVREADAVLASRTPPRQRLSTNEGEER